MISTLTLYPLLLSSSSASIEKDVPCARYNMHACTVEGCSLHSSRRMFSSIVLHLFREMFCSLTLYLCREMSSKIYTVLYRCLSVEKNFSWLRIPVKLYSCFITLKRDLLLFMHLCRENSSTIVIHHPCKRTFSGSA